MPLQANTTTEKYYQGIAPIKWNRVREAARNYGIQIAADEGQTVAWSVKIGWNYEQHKSLLKVAILDPGNLQTEEALGFIDQIIRAA